MAEYQIDGSGTCSTCKESARDQDIVNCLDCKTRFHADCNNIRPFCSNRAFLDTHIRMSRNNTNNFPFMCDHCLTRRENNEASSLKEQLAEVVKSISVLTKEVQAIKQSKEADRNIEPIQHSSNATIEKNINSKKANETDRGVWQDNKRLENVKRSQKVTVCIKKSENSTVDLKKVKEVVVKNGVQVNKVSVNKKNGDLYVDFPSDEQRDKLIPLLADEDSQNNTVINVKSKCPVITIRNVSNFVDEASFISAVKTQNPEIAGKIDAGSEFRVVFTKEHKLKEGEKPYVDNETNSSYQVVVRVNEDIRQILKEKGDRIYIGCQSIRIYDRFYVKSCAQCHRYGHYHAECEHSPRCGYCGDENHLSQRCPIYLQKDQDKYECVNCKDIGKSGLGHSSHWHKCPTYLDKQKKVMMSIPFYAKNLKQINCQESQ